MGVTRAAFSFRDETHRLCFALCRLDLLNGCRSDRSFYRPDQPSHRSVGSEGQGNSAGWEGARWWCNTCRSQFVKNICLKFPNVFVSNKKCICLELLAGKGIGGGATLAGAAAAVGAVAGGGGP